MKLPLSFACIFGFAGASVAAAIPATVETPFTPQFVHKAMQSIDPMRDEALQKSESLSFRCFNHSENPYYIGVGQFQVIHAPIETVAKVIESFSNYSQWNDGLVESRGELIGDGKWIMHTEQEVPVPFVANIKTSMFYDIKKTSERISFRYQLVKSTSLTAYDGLIVLEKVGASKTKFAEYDMFNADWGVAKAMGDAKIWSDSVKAMYQSDTALKIQAENPTRPLKEILKESTKDAGKQDFSECIKNKTSFSSVVAH